VVFLVRHGRTRLNATGVLRGRLDPPLDDVGRREAAGLAALFHPRRLAAVAASPLLRAQQTAQAIATATDAPLVTDVGLVDRDYGPWAGVARADVERRFGSLDAAPDVEPAAAFSTRVADTLTRLADAWSSGPVAVVAHDAVNRYALTRLVPRTGDPDVIPQPTGCWNRLERNSDGWTAPIVGAVPGDGRRPGADAMVQ
jgi:broad specificity phosphatase PhoE